MVSALTYISHPNGYEIYIKDDVNFERTDSAPIELIIAHLIDYLQTYYPKFNQSTSSGGTEVMFTYGYPQDSSIEINLPAIAISTRDDEHFQDSMGYIQYYNEDTGDIVKGIRMRTTIEFDIWANNPREKAFIQGILINMIHAGIVNNLLRFRGVQVAEFVRSIPRGYDQTDRVLQFHTHQIGSDEIFRQVMEFDFIFDHRLIWDFETPNELIYAIKQIITDVNGAILTSNESRSRLASKVFIS